MDQRANGNYEYYRAGGVPRSEAGIKVQQKGEEEIDLMEVMSLLLHHAWLFALAALIGALLIGIGVYLFVPAKYTAKSTIYVFDITEGASTQALTQADKLTTDFQIIATTRTTMDLVAKELNEKGMFVTTEMLIKENSISVSTPTDSHMLRISVTNRDPNVAVKVSNALANVMCERIAEIMKSERPQFVESAEFGSKSSPHVKRDALIGGFAFALVAVLFVLIRYFVNDTITTEDDVNRYLGLTILSSVPFERNITRNS